ncbi:hypothetical protein [Streptomyces sp. NBC_00892]|uniref:hypothetical protein n=1 Tax=Streptomyces sp. NBC_00892 TaxID=2975861 RepID=UPI0022541DEA|nr:hypothetical protein [Streptomyces sp. NBC_00892]MCX4902330.1 hypothetical protein [Streptomyces sp. NBC_00892]
MTDLHDRAATILGHGENGVRWPYGLEYPPPGLRRKDPEAYERRMTETTGRQAAMVAWAEHYGLRRSETGCCPLWLRRDASQRCRPRYGAGDPCTRYGAPHPDSGWMDHHLAWLKNARPAVLTAAPYEVDAHDEDRLAHWSRIDPRLRTARGQGWYGFGTTQIVLWRSDRITEVLPAEQLVGSVSPNRPNCN